jgi:hypothetical protein
MLGAMLFEGTSGLLQSKPWSHERLGADVGFEPCSLMFVKGCNREHYASPSLETFGAQ